MEIISKEAIKGFLPTYSAKDIMHYWEEGVRERFNQEVGGLYELSRNGQINESVFVQRMKEIRDAYIADIPLRDGLTGAYSRGEFYRTLAIVRELGHRKARATIFDTNFLKDHNVRLGEPTGGDYALAVIGIIARGVAEEYGCIFVRYHVGGGDDFILLEIPKEDEEFSDVGDILKERLARITPDEYFSSTVCGNQVVRFREGKPITLKSQLTDDLKEMPGLLSIIVSPSGETAVVDIDLMNDISMFEPEEGMPEKYDFNAIAEKIEKSMEDIEKEKLKKLKKLEETNPVGVNLLVRRMK